MNAQQHILLSQKIAEIGPGTLPVEQANLQAPKFEPISFATLLEKQFPPIAWMVEKIIPAEGITIISGQPGCFKTWIILDMMIQISQGNHVFDNFNTQQANILFIDEENHPRFIQDRITNLTSTKDLPIFFLSLQNFKVDTKNIEIVIQYCKDNNIKVIFIDSFVRIHNVDENDANKVSQIFSHLKQLTKSGITVVMTHHERKNQGFIKGNQSQNMRGSSDILASVDCHISVKADKEKQIITLTQTKLRIAEEFKPFEVCIKKSDDLMKFKYKGESIEEIKKTEEAKEIIPEILKTSETPLSTDEIQEIIKKEGVQIGLKSLKIALKDLVDSEIIICTIGKRNKHLYSFNATLPLPMEGIPDDPFSS